MSFHPQREAGEESSVLMVNTKPTVAESLDVAESVEDCERVPVFQYVDTVIHARGS